MRIALGDGYVEALRSAWSDVPESADFVLYWWHHAAELTRHGNLRRFGLITTNSLRQAFNRRVVEAQLSDKKQPLSLVFAIPDHPWVDSADGAAVRIAMTVGTLGVSPGRLAVVVAESTDHDGEVAVSLSERTGLLHSDLRVGADVTGASLLVSNCSISNRGVIPHGAGMVVSPSQAESLGLGRIDGLKDRVRPYRNGRDLTQIPRDVLVLDMFGLGESEVRSAFPEVYQWLHDRVKPERDENPRSGRRENWWLFGENQPKMRESIKGLQRFIATVQTSRHRFFVFLAPEILPDDKLIAIGTDDAVCLGVLSSHAHVAWALATGARLGVGNDPVYNKTRCFEAFPFPASAGAQRDTIRDLAEQLDGHRKRQQAAHPTLTLTGMYNVLEKLKTGESLTEKEKVIHEQGLVSVLKQLHDDLDLAVLDAYGWSDLAPLMQIVNGNAAAITTRDDAARELDEALLERLVALNAERAAEEKRGLIRWLRPEFQNPSGATSQTQRDIGLEDEAGDDVAAVSATQPWPKDLTEQVRAVAAVLAETATPLTESDIAARFTGRGAWRRRLPQLLEMLSALGRAREVDGGRYSGSL